MVNGGRPFNNRLSGWAAWALIALPGCHAAHLGALGTAASAPNAQAVATGVSTSGSVNGMPPGAVVTVSPGVSLAGTVWGPSAPLIANNSGALVANNTASLVANNAGSLVANNAAGLVANHGAGWQVLEVASALEPIGGARLSATDWQGQAVVGGVAVSDAQGHFALVLPPDFRGSAIVRARFERSGFSFVLAAVGTVSAAVPLVLDPATTAVTKKALALTAAGRLAPVAVSPSAIAGLASLLGGVMTDAALVRAGWEAPELGGSTFDAMLVESAPLAAAVRRAALADGAVAAIAMPPLASSATGTSYGPYAPPRATIGGVVR